MKHLLSHLKSGSAVNRTDKFYKPSAQRIYASVRDSGHKVFSKSGAADAGRKIGGIAVLGTAVPVLGVLGETIYVGTTMLSFAGACAWMAGPGGAITFGAFGLMAIVNDLYSNREAAHRKLADYVWSFIDDEPPRKTVAGRADMKEVYAASVYLITEGKAQIHQLAPKLERTKDEFNAFSLGFSACEEAAHTLLNQICSVRPANPTAAFAETITTTYIRDLKQFRETYERGMALYVSACQGTRSGGKGAVANMARRLNHMSNYLLAGRFVAGALEYSISSQNLIRTKHRGGIRNVSEDQPANFFPSGDPFSKISLAMVARTAFLRITDHAIRLEQYRRLVHQQLGTLNQPQRKSLKEADKKQLGWNLHRRTALDLDWYRRPEECPVDLSGMGPEILAAARKSAATGKLMHASNYTHPDIKRRVYDWLQP
jgi:hypothetical protein